MSAPKLTICQHLISRTARRGGDGTRCRLRPRMTLRYRPIAKAPPAFLPPATFGDAAASASWARKSKRKSTFHFRASQCLCVRRDLIYRLSFTALSREATSGFLPVAPISVIARHGWAEDHATFRVLPVSSRGFDEKFRSAVNGQGLRRGGCFLI